MAEAGLNEDGEGPGARAEGEAAGVLLSDNYGITLGTGKFLINSDSRLF